MARAINDRFDQARIKTQWLLECICIHNRMPHLEVAKQTTREREKIGTSKTIVNQDARPRASKIASQYERGTNTIQAPDTR
jgi:hypothetical protein